MALLKTYCINITDGEHASVVDTVGGEYYLLSNKNIVDGQIVIGQNERTIDKVTFERINKRINLEEGDVLISTVGTIGKSAIVPADINYVFQRSVGIIKTNKDLLLPEYLLYVLQTPEYQKMLTNSSKGGVQKCLFISDLHNIEIEVPSIEEQKRIVAPIVNIDRKIALNRRINQKLEETARRLYDYWFLQFDFPAPAGSLTADGHPIPEGAPYRSSGGAMRVCDEFANSIPNNFTVDDILDLCEVIDCLHSKKPDFCYEDENHYMLTLENLVNGQIVTKDKFYISSSDYNVWTKNIEAQENDFLFTNAGRAGDVAKMPIGKKCAIGRNITAVRPHSIDPYYLKFFFDSLYTKQQITKNLDSGAFFMSFNVKSIKKLRILHPDVDTLRSFSQLVSPMIIEIEKNNDETQKLFNLRDRLLPLLMNGQVTLI